MERRGGRPIPLRQLRRHLVRPRHTQCQGRFLGPLPCSFASLGLLVTLAEVLSRAGKMRGVFRSLKTPNIYKMVPSRWIVLNMSIA